MNYYKRLKNWYGRNRFGRNAGFIFSIPLFLFYLKILDFNSFGAIIIPYIFIALTAGSMLFKLGDALGIFNNVYCEFVGCGSSSFFENMAVLLITSFLFSLVGALIQSILRRFRR